MLRIRGSQALSSFRKDKLLVQAQQQFDSIHQIDSEFQHLVQLQADSELDDQELAKIESLLTYGPKRQQLEHKGQRIYVVPRFGTVSPWSTKATDIAQHCGLDKVVRIERGIAYFIQSKGALEHSQLEEIASGGFRA